MYIYIRVVVMGGGGGGGNIRGEMIFLILIQAESTHKGS